LFRALAAFEEFGREPTVPILRHGELELAHPGDEGAAIVARAVTEPSGRALALFGSVISASSISCITVGTSSRSASGLLAKSSLTAAIVGLASVLAMTARQTALSPFSDFCRILSTYCAPPLVQGS
jgi:hypothetical protein